VPAFRFTVRVLLPPWKVGVAPTTGPLVPCWIVMLCISGDMLVKTIVTLPAFALSELFVYFNAPLGSAELVRTLLACAAPAGAEADVDVLEATEDDAELALLAVVLELELPHAATPSISATALRAIAEYLDKGFLLSLLLANGMARRWYRRAAA
jgi:hypothetical protein